MSWVLNVSRTLPLAPNLVSWPDSTGGRVGAQQCHLTFPQLALQHNISSSVLPLKEPRVLHCLRRLLGPQVLEVLWNMPGMKQRKTATHPEHQRPLARGGDRARGEWSQSYQVIWHPPLAALPAGQGGAGLLPTCTLRLTTWLRLYVTMPAANWKSSSDTNGSRQNKHQALCSSGHPKWMQLTRDCNNNPVVSCDTVQLKRNFDVMLSTLSSLVHVPKARIWLAEMWSSYEKVEVVEPPEFPTCFVE